MSVILTAMLLVVLLSSCSLGELVSRAPELPEGVPQIPGLPEDLTELPGMLEQLGIPDLANLSDLPGLDSLPSLEQTPGSLTFRGPIEMRLAPGEMVGGTDIRFVGTSGDGAEFTIGGLSSVRSLGDSLDYDGTWNDSGELSYHLRARIYQIGDGTVRMAGVHQLTVRNSHLVERSVSLGEPTLRFPYTVGVNNGAVIAGTTYGYGGDDDQGAALTGLEATEYPYRKVGDSIVWEGEIHPAVTARYSLRMLRYDAQSARVGGVVTLSLPAGS